MAPGARRTEGREPADWSACRDPWHYGLVAVDVGPGATPQDDTTLTVSYVAVTGPAGEMQERDRLVLRRARRRGPRRL